MGVTAIPRVAGMAVAIALMAELRAAQPFGWMEKRIDSLWCSLPGSMVTVAVGTGLAAPRGRTDQALTPDPAVTERMA